MKNICLWNYKLTSFVSFCYALISTGHCTFSDNCQNLCASSVEGELAINNLCNVSDITRACTQGCQFWNATVQENCPLKCNQTYIRACERISCKFGCSCAENAYGIKIQDYLNTPTAPFASIIGSHNVTLRWKSANISWVKYIIQWKYNQLPGDWRYTEVTSEHSYTVNNLQAFTEYVFRIVWILTSQLQLYSPPSPSYRTYPSGVPVTAPIIKDIESSGPYTIEVSWSPPLFSSGLIVGYNLLLTSERQELRGATSSQSFQFFSTLPNTTYRFMIEAVNMVGAGPFAEATITTPESEVKEKAKWLFLTRYQSLRKRSMESFLEAAECLQSNVICNNITGIAVNVYQQAVYFSVGNSIWVKGAASMSDVSDLKLFYTGLGTITSISVDWLYQMMYFVMNAKVYICSLENCTVAEDITPPSVTSPRKVIADPYNGYIFYLLEDGIYRASLPTSSDLITAALLVVRIRAPKDFVINYQSKRLIFFYKERQSFVSCFLDGSGFNELRPKVSFADIESFVYENNTLVVTNGRAVFHEEMSANGISSFNEYIADCSLTDPDYFGYGNLLFYGSSTQPFPLPSPPQLVTALFGSDRAVVTWKPPEPTIGTNPSAWKNWTYILKVSSQGSADEDLAVSNISHTNFTVRDLSNFTAYEVSVRALSPAGEGPWSESFKGTTLKEVEEEPYILAVGNEGLWKQRLDHFGPGEFLCPDLRNVTDLDWYDDTLYWSNSIGEVHMWSLSRRAPAIVNSPLSDIKKARILAFDWLGQCLYWAGKANTIYRKSLLAGHTDVVVYVTFLVKDLVIDSVNGYLYWATAYSVESTRLNGEYYLMLQEQPQFSNKQVVSLALDLSGGFLYWFVQDNLHLNLYRVSLCEESCGNAVVTELAAWSSSGISQNALVYYSERLFWINAQQFITTQEVGQSVGIPFSEPAAFSAFTLVQRSLKPLPGNFSFVPKVIPDSVVKSSFKIEQNSSRFHILWNAVTNVDWGVVFYCVESKVLQAKFADNERYLRPHNLTVPVYTVEGLEPYTLFDFTVTPYTYWGKGPMTSTFLRSPEEVPSAPTSPRIYVLHYGPYEGKEKALVEFRWDKPRRENGALTEFRIYYQIGNQSDANENFTEWSISKTAPSVMSFSLKAVLPRLTIRFQVQALTFVGPGPLSDIAEIKSTDLFPVPTLITVSSNEMALIDIDRNQTIKSLPIKDVNQISYTANDETMYYIEEDCLFHLNIPNNSVLQLFKDGYLRNATAIAIDWIARHVFVAHKTLWSGAEILVIDLELKARSLKTLNIQPTNRNLTISSLLAFPFLSRLYWMETLDYGAWIFYYDTLNNTAYHVLGDTSLKHQTRNNCSCNLTETDLGRAMTIDMTDSKKPHILFVKGRDEIWASDMDGCYCWRVIHVPSHQDMTFGSLTVDRQFIYWSIITKDYTTIYQANKESKALFIQERAYGKLQILAYSLVMQPYPDKECLILASNAEKPIVSPTNTSITVRLPPVKTQLLCPGITLPTPTYLVYYGKIASRGMSCSSGLQCRIMESQKNITVIEGLDPFSRYVIQVAVKNYYSETSEQPSLGKETIGTTFYGVPEAVGLIEVLVLCDNTINISWSEPSQPNGPRESIRYQILINFLPAIPATPLKKSEFPNGKLAWSINNLQSGTKYKIKVLAFHPRKNWFSESAPVFATTFETPPVPVNIIARNTSVQLEWTLPLHVNKTSFWFELQKWQTKNYWFSPATTSCAEGPRFTCNLTGILPHTAYFVRAGVIYVTGTHSISPPASFKTMAGVPSKPGIPKREENKNVVQWQKAEDNGSNLTYHILESRRCSHNTSKMKPSWEVVYNDSCTDVCIWRAKNTEGTFQFRAAAANLLGLGEYSGISENIVLVKDTAPFPEASIVIAVVIGITGLILIVFALVAFVWHQRWKSRKLTQPGQIVFVKEDKELAQLRGLHDAVGLANACYAVHNLPTPGETESLPAFPREKLNLHKLLGTGAFGEVYEGTAVDIMAAGSRESKVAVKTLKKGATDYEKSEFLKEAHLMSKFDHPHILKLLGVCLLNEPQYIILELMEGGDLLSYLRGARMQKFQSPLLTLVDLLDICLDICKGCVYLEKMHFIHRDLAARNCLVSVKEYSSASRIVKIGDFGLARDIYKNDYYRKRGEGLLPVRWMAPESLIDGVFTSRSDVWSFGVLVWETLTLGHQPYPGFSTLEVLHHVRSGGRLEMPNNCPDNLWDLVIRCWVQEPCNRPTFCYIQDQMQEVRNSPLCYTSHLYSKTLSTGVINQAFEDSDALCTDSDSIISTALEETKNEEGLNYLVLVRESNPDEENSNSNGCNKI
ncbi:proto-oncogene tyrosine-protein kinase ROS isoform X2 [Alligator sinensis]|uniref:Tyrosine-protein kinase receptor n=2 Tax=Alligator sinensis TaxID=38654 RepID=A0A1U7RUM0_ALLSI|nr:proto-oncogene tyrosine-protein kinase ROS isoform X2 [Alligator sinensis]